MARRTYKKPHRAKKKKPLVAKASFWRAVFGISAAGGLVWLVCFSPALEVKEIKITGNEKVNGQDCVKVIEEEISKKIAMFDSKSILLFNLDQAKKDILARYPQIQDIKIERQFPSKIYASVEERRGIAVFSAGGKNYLIDDSGIGFQEVDAVSDLLLISDSRDAQTELGGSMISKEVLSGILRMRGGIIDPGGLTAAAAVIATSERVNLQTNEGWFVYFNPLKDIDSQLTKLIAVLKDDSFKAKRANLEYVDVRFTRVYLKEKDSQSSGNGVYEKKENSEVLKADD